MKKSTIVFIVLDILVAICFFVTYGVKSFKNTVIATAMVTKDHQWIAFTFYSDKTINAVLAAGAYIPFEEGTNLDDIVIDTKPKSSYDNEYEEQILSREEGDLYKLIEINEGGKIAYLVAIYDPSKVKLMTAKVFGSGSDAGLEPVINMCRRYGAVVGINGGGFVDVGDTYDTPIGYVIKDGNIVWSDTTEAREMVAITKDNKLLLKNMTGDEALKLGVRDAVEFGPYLIVNGKPLQFVNEDVGGYSRATRSVIAQRKDGIMFFFVTKGVRHGTSGGWTIGDLITVLQRYGAYNAANMDGGTSATLVVNNKVVNSPVNYEGMAANGGIGRYVVDSWGLIP